MMIVIINSLPAIMTVKLLEYYVNSANQVFQLIDVFFLHLIMFVFHMFSYGFIRHFSILFF